MDTPEEYRRVLVTRYGYVDVPCGTDEEALEYLKILTVSDIEWENRLSEYDLKNAKVIGVYKKNHS